MFLSLRTIAISTAVIGAGIVGALAADKSEHPYALGTVWNVSYIETKPGHFDDYMKYISTVWRLTQENEKKAGRVISYKVLAVSSPRDNEPDLILMVEQPNWAVNDTPLSVIDAATKAVEGSIKASNDAFAARGEIRTLRGGLQAQELLVSGK